MPDAAPARSDYNKARLGAAAFLLGLVLFTAFVPLPGGPLEAFTRHLFVAQDVWLAPAFIAACLIQPRAGRTFVANADRERQIVWLLIGMVLLVCWLGREIVLSDFDSSPDERMVAFDAAIFRRGALMWPIPPEWRPLALALNQTFILPIGNAEAWVSAYLPINAAFHAVVGLLVDEDLTSPLFVALGAYALWRISLRLWPDSLGARATALALYAGSSQILVMGMTKFAMSAHLGLNLCWLLLFLRGGRVFHALAILVGFLATGLHQPLFHPLFALPFFGMLAHHKRWHLLGAYLFAYACISAFWLAWPLWISSFATTAPADAGVAISHMDRLLGMLKMPDLTAAWFTGANLTRFITWQHPLLLVLAVFGVWAHWRSEPLVRALAIGLALPILVCWLVLPWQGPGWGYRYAQPVLGNAILLGGWGWLALEQRGRSLWQPLVTTTAIALFLMLPLHGWMARMMTSWFAITEARIARIDSDVLVLDDELAQWFTYNNPDLSIGSVRLFGASVTPGQIGRICSSKSVAFLDPFPGQPTDGQKALKSAAAGAGCTSRTVRIKM